MLISKSPVFFQHTPGGVSPGWGLCLRRGWMQLPQCAWAIQLLFVLVVIYTWVIFSACWVIYD